MTGANTEVRFATTTARTAIASGRCRGNSSMTDHLAPWLRRHKPTENSWRAMKGRVSRQEGYVGVVDMDPRWLNYETFLHDMGERPESTTIDRIDGTKGYWPWNCRWATKTQQNHNRRKIYGSRSNEIGVFPRRGRFDSVFSANGKTHFLGRFDTEEEASLAHLVALDRYERLGVVRFIPRIAKKRGQI